MIESKREPRFYGMVKMDDGDSVKEFAEIIMQGLEVSEKESLNI